MSRPKAWMSWSSGKDSAYALHLARSNSEVDVVGLLTTVNQTFDRVAMHAVRRELLEAQAERLGLPLHVIELPHPCSNEIYEERMRAGLAAAFDDDIESMIFGDLFLEDIRAYRERMLADHAHPIRPLFPLWGRSTDALVRTMLDHGIAAWTTCIDPKKLPNHFVGRLIDDDFLAELPDGIDPCGENGEFHTFVANGPGFRAPIPVRPGDVVERDGFVFADLLPG